MSNAAHAGTSAVSLTFPDKNEPICSRLLENLMAVRIWAGLGWAGLGWLGNTSYNWARSSPGSFPPTAWACSWCPARGPPPRTPRRRGGGARSPARPRPPPSPTGGSAAGPRPPPWPRSRPRSRQPARVRGEHDYEADGFILEQMVVFKLMCREGSHCGPYNFCCVSTEIFHRKHWFEDRYFVRQSMSQNVNVLHKKGKG